MKKLKIALDLDGTAYAHMRFFREFMKAMQAAGHQVGILTGHEQRCAENDMAFLDAHGFNPDFYIGKGPDDSPHGPVMKSKAIADHGIDYYFDDFDYDEARALTAYEDGGQLKRIFKVHHRGKGVRAE